MAVGQFANVEDATEKLTENVDKEIFCDAEERQSQTPVQNKSAESFMSQPLKSRVQVQSRQMSTSESREKTKTPSQSDILATQVNVTTTQTSQWRCACEGGFLPPGMFGNMEAVLKMGSGQCYHKQS